MCFLMDQNYRDMAQPSIICSLTPRFLIQSQRRWISISSSSKLIETSTSPFIVDGCIGTEISKIQEKAKDLTHQNFIDASDEKEIGFRFSPGTNNTKKVNIDVNIDELHACSHTII